MSALVLRPYQEAAVRAIAQTLQRTQKAGIIVPTGGGKCLGHGTPVMMANGDVKAVQDIVPGDKLMGPDSTPRNVISTTIGTGKLYKIIPVKGEPWVCNGDHILSLKHTETKEITNVSVDTWFTYSKYKKHCLKLYRAPIDFAHDAPGELEPYFLGLWLGDGRFEGAIIHKDEPEITEYLRGFAERIDARLSVYKTENRQTSYGIVGDNVGRNGANPIFGKIANEAIVANEKRIPARYLRNSKEVRLELLAGLLDTDGYLHNNHYEIVTRYPGLKDDILFLARSLGLAAYSTVKKVKLEGWDAPRDYQRITISGHLDQIPCKLPRKKATARGQKKDVLVTGFTIEPLGTGDYYGFELTGDKLFLLGDFTVTHNTEIFCQISDLFLKHNQGKAVLVLSHLSILTTQTLERFQKRMPHLKVGIYQADRSPASDCQVIIGTMQTSRNGEKTEWLKLLLKYPIGLIIIDEAHYIQTESYEKAISYFPQAKVLGCTATPFRAGALMVNYFDEIAFSISMQELIDQGYLVPPRLVQIDMGYQETTTADRIATVARIYEEKEKGKNAIVFMDSIESAKEMRNVLTERGVKARAVTSELVGEDREKILADFRSGEIQVLTTVNVLTAGFDSPNVEAIFMPYATQSPVTYLQRIGRGLRPCQENQKKDCRIYVCGDAPSIKRELYQKLHDKVLQTGGEKQKSTTFTDDLAYNDYEKSSEVYLWTATVVHTVEKMEKLGMERLAKMLNEKKFPMKFLKDITTLRESLPPEMPKLANGELAMTQSQKNTLRDNGFNDQQLQGVTKNEASAMIATIMTAKDKYRATPFIIPNGKFAGMHIKNTTWYYRQAVLRQNPNGVIGKMIKDWEASGGSFEKASGSKRRG